MDVLVTGGTGFLGSVLVPQLVDAGHEVRVMTRRNRPTLPLEVSAVRGDLLTGDGLGAAVAGADVIVHGATSAFRRTRATDVEGTRRLVRKALAETDPPHLIFPSIVGIDQHPLPYYRSKAEAEAIVTQSGLPYSILRGTQFHVLIDYFFERALRLPVSPVVKGWLIQPVDESEFAAELVNLVASDPTGRVDEFGGPQVLTAAEMAGEYLAARGRRSQLVRVPAFGKTLEAYVSGQNVNKDATRGTVTWTDWLASHPVG